MLSRIEKFRRLKPESILAHWRYPYRVYFSPEVSDFATVRRFEFRHFIARTKLSPARANTFFVESSSFIQLENELWP